MVRCWSSFLRVDHGNHEHGHTAYRCHDYGTCPNTPKNWGNSGQQARLKTSKQPWTVMFLVGDLWLKQWVHMLLRLGRWRSIHVDVSISFCINTRKWVWYGMIHISHPWLYHEIWIFPPVLHPKIIIFRHETTHGATTIDNSTRSELYGSLTKIR